MGGKKINRKTLLTIPATIAVGSTALMILGTLILGDVRVVFGCSIPLGVFCYLCFYFNARQRFFVASTCGFLSVFTPTIVAYSLKFLDTWIYGFMFAIIVAILAYLSSTYKPKPS
ncbi:MAG: hypothetical protein QW321_02810 [Candidatus Aenigmatarchaeota archaeon]